MIQTTQFSLDNARSTKVFSCPSCHKKTMKRYKNNETGAYLSDEVGRCNREIKCGYHLSPKQYFAENAQIEKQEDYLPVRLVKQAIVRLPTFLPDSLIQQSLKAYQENHFVQYLQRIFDKNMVEKLVVNYRIGTSKYWQGATVFWQIDENAKVRTGKIMLYDAQNGKRIKAPFNHIQWVHSVLKYTDFELSQCFFGTHLLSEYPHKTVAVVESEKTAIIASAFIPDCIWLASGGLSQLSPQKWEVLANRNVILYPDLGAFDKWQAKADALKKGGVSITVSNILEKKASETDRKNGLDIADYLLQEKPKTVFTQAEILLGKMTTKNPQIMELIRVFGLINPQTGMAYRFEKSP